MSPKLRFAGLQLCLALQSSHCHHRFTSLLAVGTALLPAVDTAFSSRILGFRPWLFFFTDSWVPTLAVFSSLKLSPLTATRNLCRPRFVATLDMRHWFTLEVLDSFQHTMTALGIGSIQLTPGLDLHPLQTSSCPELPGLTHPLQCHHS